MSTTEFLEKFGLLGKYRQLVQSGIEVDQNYGQYLDGIVGTTSYAADQSLTTLLNNPPIVTSMEPINFEFHFIMPDPTVPDTQLGLNFVQPEPESPAKLEKKIILKLKMADMIENPATEASPKKRRKRSGSSDGEKKKKRKNSRN